MHWLPTNAKFVSIDMRVSGAVSRRKEKESVRTFSLRPRTLDLPPVALASLDRKYVLLSGSLVFRITDPVKVVEQSKQKRELYDLVEKVGVCSPVGPLAE